MRIGVLTFYRAHNCGAMLQAYALKKVLENYGHSVVFVNPDGLMAAPNRWMAFDTKDLHGFRLLKRSVYCFLRNVLSVGYNRQSPLRYELFRAKHLQEKILTENQYERVFDLLIVGSDQVWSPRIAQAYLPYFYVNKDKVHLPVVSYAGSCGDDVRPAAFYQDLARVISHYKFISVREASLAEGLGRIFTREIPVVCDPTLLVSRTEFDKIASNDLVPKDEYLLVFTVSITEKLKCLAKATAAMLGVRLLFVPGEAYSRLGAEKWWTIGISPDRLIGLIRSAKYVMACSFHGAALGVVYGKPTVAICEQRKLSGSRMKTLFRTLGVGHCVVPLSADACQTSDLLQAGDTAKPEVVLRIEDYRDQSMQILQEMIKK